MVRKCIWNHSTVISTLLVTLTVLDHNTQTWAVLFYDQNCQNVILCNRPHCKFIGRKESVYMRKDFCSHRVWVGTQTQPQFNCFGTQKQDSKKVPSSHLGQVDCLAVHWSNFTFSFVQWAKAQVCCWSTESIKSKLRLAQDKGNLIATCLKGKLEFKFFSSPE